MIRLVEPDLDHRLHRIGEEAEFVCLVVHLFLELTAWNFTGVADLRAQLDAADHHPAIDLLHHAHRIIDIAVDADALLRRDPEIEQHVAAGERRDIGLLRIDIFFDGIGQRHIMRRCGSRHRDAAVECPAMTTAVAPVGKATLAQLPRHLRRKRRHPSSPSRVRLAVVNFRCCKSAWRARSASRAAHASMIA